MGSDIRTTPFLVVLLSVGFDFQRSFVSARDLGVGDVNQNEGKYMSNATDGLAKDATSTVSDAYASTSGIASGRSLFTNGISTMASSFFSNTSSAASGIYSSGATAASGLYSGVKSAASGLHSGIAVAASRVASTVGHVATNVAGRVGLVVLKSIKIGSKIIDPPSQGTEKIINAWAFLRSAHANLVKQLFKSSGITIASGWEAIKAIDFPGKAVVMYLPKGVISVADHGAHTARYIYSKTTSAVLAANAVAIYAALDIVSHALNPVIRSLGLSCVDLPIVKKDFTDSTLISRISTEKGSICGLDHLMAVNNITITNDNKSFLVLEVPYVILNISAVIPSVNVSTPGIFGTPLENSPVKVDMQFVFVEAVISFRRGTLLSFATIGLRVVSIKGFKIKVLEETLMSGMIEGLSNVLSGPVKDAINEKLADSAFLMSKLIAK